jgi:hypothetical protein
MKEKRVKLRRVDVYLDPTLAKVLSIAARREDRTLSNYISRVLDRHVDVDLDGGGKVAS